MIRGTFKFNQKGLKKQIQVAAQAAAEEHALKVAKQVLNENGMSDVQVSLSNGALTFSHTDPEVRQNAADLVNQNLN